MSFEIIGPVASVDVIATGRRIRDAEIHWYEATGIGRRELKVKDYLW